MVRSLASYARLLPALVAAVGVAGAAAGPRLAGDAELGAGLLQLVDPLRYPPEGTRPRPMLEIRRLKARMEAERLPRGADPATAHQARPRRADRRGVGGPADPAPSRRALPALRTTRTLDALDAAVAEGLLAKADEAVLAEAWRFASRIRDAIVAVRGRASDTLPVDVRERMLIARALGYPPEGTEDFVDDYRRATRRARRVVERVFYED